MFRSLFQRLFSKPQTKSAPVVKFKTVATISPVLLRQRRLSKIVTFNHETALVVDFPSATKPTDRTSD